MFVEYVEIICVAIHYKKKFVCCFCVVSVRVILCYSCVTIEIVSFGSLAAESTTLHSGVNVKTKYVPFTLRCPCHNRHEMHARRTQTRTSC